jgi:hypothetical protein
LDVVVKEVIFARKNKEGEICEITLSFVCNVEEKEGEIYLLMKMNPIILNF